MQSRKSSRKENIFIVDDTLQICRITTSLTKKLNTNIKLWKADTSDIRIHEHECIIDNDAELIDLLRENYLVFYDPANAIRRTYRQSPKPVPYETSGYFWAWHIHDKTRIPLARLIWQYNNKREIPCGYVVDHGNDLRFINTASCLSILTQHQNISKLRYPQRILGAYSITMVSHPSGLPIKLLRFKDELKGEQELLIYNVENDMQLLLTDLNSFKNIVDVDAEKFKQHFENLKMTSRNYMTYTKQSTTGDSFTDEIYSFSIDWQKINELIRIERFMTLAS